MRVGAVGGREGVLPVRPQPVLVEAGVEVVPGQHLVVVPLARGEPGEVDAGAVESALGRGDPAVVGEVLAPAVEAAAVAPHLLDDPADAAVAAREQSLDGAGLAVVVAEADGAAEALVLTDRVAQLLQPLVGGLVVELGGPLEGGVRLRHEAADRDRAADVVATGDLTALGDHPLGEVGDLRGRPRRSRSGGRT